MLARVLAMIVSVCLSVTRRYCIKTATRKITQITPRDSLGAAVFWRQKSLVEDPSSRWNLRSKWPTPCKTTQRWPISAHSTSTVRAGEKRSISTNRKSTTRFPTSHRWTMYVTPKSPKGWHKTRFCCFCQSNPTSIEKSVLQSFFVWKCPAAKL